MEHKNEKPHCQFYLNKKKRFCRFQPKPNHQYCAEHACIKGVDIGRKRIPCPLNSNHNCYEDELDRHLKKCNVAKRQKATEESEFYVKNINVDFPKNDAKNQTTVKELTSEQLQKLIMKVDNLFQKHVGPVENSTVEHPCVREEYGDDKWSTLDGQYSLKKELLQQSSLIGQLDKLTLLSDDHCFVELGAGRGKLSHWVHRACRNCKRNSYLLVDRSSVRYTMDSHHRESFKRIRVDIADLCLGYVSDLQDQSSVVVMGKHLCGGATDMGLSCAVETLAKRKSTDDVSEVDGPTRSLPKAIMIALCCHHQCDWATYLGKTFMSECGVSPLEFNLITRLSSWATCARVRPQAATQHSQDSKSESEPAVPPGDLLTNPQAETDPIEHHTDHDTGLERWNISSESVSLQKSLSVKEREVIGRKCKRLIDQGRLEYLRSKGMQCRLSEYIGEDLTPENVVLLATRPQQPGTTVLTAPERDDS